jgi:Family of unknown function (DUF6152)
MNARAIAIASTAVSLLALPAAAHHSFAMFDQQKVVTLTGTVKNFEWVNPHSWIYLMVADANGAPIQWAIEMGSPAQTSRIGWKPDSIKPGDQVTIEMNPLKDGTRGGTIVSLTLPDGKKLGRAGQTNNPLGADQ